MYDKNNNDANYETVLFKGRPHVFFSCKLIFLLVMVLGSLSFLAPLFLTFIAEIQVQLVGFINIPLTTYTSFLILIISFLIIAWMLWILLKWRATEYIITNFRIVLKEGILIRKSHHMPFNHIQDITVSQGIFRRIVSIGHVIVVNAYDLTDIEFKDVHNPEVIQEMIFNEMNRNNQDFDDRNNYPYQNRNFRDFNNENHLNQDKYYQAQNQFNNHQGEDSNFVPSNNRHYHEINDNDFLNNSINEAMNNLDRKNRFNNKKYDNFHDYPQNSYREYKNRHDPYFIQKKHYDNENFKKNKKANENLSVIDIYSKKFKRRRK